jgi:hypothetical protein
LPENRRFSTAQPIKTAKTRKKPVETQENPLTSISERLIVNCGTFFRTRINTGDFAILTLAEGRRT